MAERLTIRHGNRTDCNTLCMEDCDHCWHLGIIREKLARLEDLEEQGRLIELPCKIGDTVWDIKWWDDTTETRVIDGKTYFRRVMKHKVTKSKFKLFDYDSFGKTIFLTREEAEEALKEVDE